MMITTEKIDWALQECKEMLKMYSDLVSHLETFLQMPKLTEKLKEEGEKLLTETREKVKFYENEIQTWPKVRALLEGSN